MTEETRVKITEAGDYPVIIGKPRWEQLEEKDGDPNRMVLVMPLETEPDENSQVGTINFYLYFTDKIISSGANAGRALYEIGMETCCKLGMSEPFNPKNIGQLENAEAFVVVTEDEDQKGNPTIRARFLNSRRRPALSTDEASAIFETFGSDGTIEQQNVEGIGDDDIPF